MDPGREARRGAHVRGAPGVRFTAASFTPKESTFAGKPCEGVEFAVVDRDAFDPIRTGLTLARAAHALPRGLPAQGLLLLLGNQAAYDALLRGDAVESLVAGFAPQLAAFAKVRARYLLYP